MALYRARCVGAQCGAAEAVACTQGRRVRRVAACALLDVGHWCATVTDGGALQQWHQGHAAVEFANFEQEQQLRGRRVTDVVAVETEPHPCMVAATAAGHLCKLWRCEAMAFGDSPEFRHTAMLAPLTRLGDGNELVALHEGGTEFYCRGSSGNIRALFPDATELTRLFSLGDGAWVALTADGDALLRTVRSRQQLLVRCVTDVAVSAGGRLAVLLADGGVHTRAKVLAPEATAQGAATWMPPCPATCVAVTDELAAAITADGHLWLQLWGLHSWLQTDCRFPCPVHCSFHQHLISNYRRNSWCATQTPTATRSTQYAIRTGRRQCTAPSRQSTARWCGRL
eukprot:TRINITY_DN1535_c0_g1_i5.p1 TRINITY_DN1535_c0_g1~~TRINITY_DN1535_c0_g1_i5.p1  ORF type:complete len:341 (-),score=65.88 TRINITY_DN1535_c0_g1_i5:1080-2102(-)